MDLDYLLFLQGVREGAPAFVEQFFLLVSAVAISNALVFLPCLLYWCLDKRKGLTVVFAFSLSGLCNQLIKNTVCCYRPWMRSDAIRPSERALPAATGYSFPSGHTQTATSVIGGTGWMYRKRRPILFGLCAALVLLVAFSRNFLGVHTPQDVLVALVEGAVFVVVAERLLAWADEAPGRDRTVLVVALLVTVAFIAYVMLKPYPMDRDAAGQLLADPFQMQVDCFKTAGVFCAAGLGWYLERRYLGFEVDPKALGLKGALVRLAIGLVVVLVLHMAPRLLAGVLADERWYQFVRHFFTIFAAVFVAPLAFTAVERRRA